ncbi:hypothetical protein E4T38_02994 [Aureobasidium subglaciale]|nr:hypothetical protein E4T38_02994 [Aureobasidium subglaciale]KAI5226914.1 hypothetical protein E4T40_02768 [Aureobasidium subglaciale]KAI5230216.1 hypothetical protein E4T41_02991 [Aureobasidium subglaciale]KAI5264724.1 hypothetical protein E4T46_02769 [Aureobasidium subglaciale]
MPHPVDETTAPAAANQVQVRYYGPEHGFPFAVQETFKQRGSVPPPKPEKRPTARIAPHRALKAPSSTSNNIPVERAATRSPTAEAAKLVAAPFNTSNSELQVASERQDHLSLLFTRLASLNNGSGEVECEDEVDSTFGSDYGSADSIS